MTLFEQIILGIFVYVWLNISVGVYIQFQKGNPGATFLSKLGVAIIIVTTLPAIITRLVLFDE